MTAEPNSFRLTHGVLGGAGSTGSDAILVLPAFAVLRRCGLGTPSLGPTPHPAARGHPSAPHPVERGHHPATSSHAPAATTVEGRGRPPPRHGMERGRGAGWGHPMVHGEAAVRLSHHAMRVSHHAVRVPVHRSHGRPEVTWVTP